jgi:hypothetical protein
MNNVAFAVLIAAALLPTAQESKPIPKDSVEVQSRGCLKGRVFTGIPRLPDEGTLRGPDITGMHFRVSGPKDVTDLVKRYNGQLVEVVGIVRKAALDDQGIGMKIGRGARVVIGNPNGDPTRMNAPNTTASVPTMDVSAIRYLSDRCPIE